MRFADYIQLALKNLIRQKTRTFLTVVAITIGSLSVILMASIIISIRQSLINSFKEMGAFELVTVVKDPNYSDNPQLISGGTGSPDSDDGKKIDDTTVKNLKQITNVIDATPTLSVWIKTIRLENNPKKLWGNILAFDPNTNVFEMPMLAGRKLMADDINSIVVGFRFAQELGFAGNPESLIGQSVILSQEGSGGSAVDWGPTPIKPPLNANKEWYESQPKELQIKAQIVGIADNRSMDDGQSYINISWARKLMTQVRWEYDDSAFKACEEKFQRQEEIRRQQSKSENGRENFQPQQSTCDGTQSQKLMKDDQFVRSGYGSVILRVDNTSNIDTVVTEIEKLGYGAVTAQKMINQINKIFSLVSLILGIIGGISLFVAAIGIINTMLMATLERTREIGVFRACGATRMTIRMLFAIEAALLGLIGGICGLCISIILIQLARIAVVKFGANLGNIPLDQIGNFPFWLVLAVIASTTLIGLLSGLYPAIRASKLNPVEALRYE